MPIKPASQLKVNDVIINGIHRRIVTAIVEINDKAIHYSFQVISEKSPGFGNKGTEYFRLGTKLKIQ